MVGRKLLTWDDVVKSRVRYGKRGRNGSAALRELLLRQAGTEVPESALERALLLLLQDAGIDHLLEQQVEVHDADGFVMRVDFANRERRVAIELDSLAFHLYDAQAFHADRAKRNRLALMGWNVFAFTWRQVIDDPNRVIRQIRRALGLP